MTQIMEKSDLDSFQNIVNPNEKKSGRNSLNNQVSIISATNINASSGSVIGNVQSSLSAQPVCQVCGAYLKIDSNILKLSEPIYRQLGTPFGYRDDFETTLCSGGNVGLIPGMGSVGIGVVGMSSSGNGGPNIDVDMELSLNANLIGSSTNPGTTITSAPGEDLIEPLYRKSIASMIDADSTTTAAHSQFMTAQQVECGWSARINATTALFDMMSSNTSIDHPLCEECADLLVNQLDVQCKIVENEYADYTQLIARLNQQGSSESEIAELEKELAALESEENELIVKIQNAEKEREKQEKERNERLSEEAALLQQEQVNLLEYSNIKRQLIKLEEKQESLDNQLQNTKFHFQRLRTVNVLNAAFHIWHSGPFGTINFFRLGRMPGITVEWDEINAGLGQANLLLYCLANRLNLEFKRYRLVPNGSYSYIEMVDSSGAPEKNSEELNMHRTKVYKYYFDSDKKFERGMTAFLDCLKQLEEKINSLDREFSLPYKINQHKLEDKNGSCYSIKLELNSSEEWTKALKYMLTNLKWSLAWVVSNKN